MQIMQSVGVKESTTLAQRVRHFVWRHNYLASLNT